MRRRLFTLLSALSLLLCAGTCVLWVRSYGDADSRDLPSDLAAYSYSGKLVLVRDPNRDPNGAFQVGGQIRKIHLLSIPFWSVVAVSAGLPTAWAVTRFRSKEPNQGQRACCSTCGYDLRATPERCPECGTVAKA
jgi:hypothetical protein